MFVRVCVILKLCNFKFELLPIFGAKQKNFELTAKIEKFELRQIFGDSSHFCFPASTDSIVLKCTGRGLKYGRTLIGLRASGRWIFSLSF